MTNKGVCVCLSNLYLRSPTDSSGTFLDSFDSTNTRSGVSGIAIRLNNTDITCGPKDIVLIKIKSIT